MPSISSKKYKNQQETNNDSDNQEEASFSQSIIPHGIFLYRAPSKANLFSYIRKYENKLKRIDLFEELIKSIVFQCILIKLKNL